MGEAIELARGLAWSQGSVAAALAGATLVAVVVTWWRWSSRALAVLWSIPRRILVTGSRGKSSTVRLLHAAFTAGGVPAIAKTTGTASQELTVTGEELHTRRIGQVSVLEILETAARETRRAGTAPQAVIVECMAVSPDLIAFVSERIVRPTEVVLMNALWDHLEEEGSTLQEIASSMARAFPGARLAVTAEPRDETVAVIASRARDAGVPIVRCEPGDLAPAERALVPDSHPANVAAALAVAAANGIARADALRGMAAATREPGEGSLARMSVGGMTVSYVDIGSVNDTDSLELALQGAREAAEPGSAIIGVLVSRWDRLLRAVQFAGALQPGDVDGVIVLGSGDVAVRAALRRGGWPRDRLLRLGEGALVRRSLLPRIVRFAAHVHGGLPPAVHVIAMENVHQEVADALRRSFRDPA